MIDESKTNTLIVIIMAARDCKRIVYFGLNNNSKACAHVARITIE